MTHTPRTNMQLLRMYLAPHWPAMVTLLAMLIAATGAQLGMPRLLGAFIDRAVGEAGTSSLTGLAAVYLALAGANQLLRFGTAYISQNLAWKATNALRSDLFSHCLGLDMAFHHRRTPGELIQRIDGDVGDLSNLLSQFGVTVLSNALLLTGVLVVLSRSNWKIGLGLTAFVLVTLAIFHLTRNLAVPARRQMNETVARIFGYIEERLGGLHDIRANGATQHALNGLYLLGRQRYGTLQRGYFMGSVRWAVAMTMFLFGNLLALGFGAWLFLRGKASIGTVYIIYNYTNLLLDPLRQISDQLQDFQKAAAGMVRVLELFAIRPESAACAVSASLPTGALAVEARDLVFAYEEGVQALDGVTLRVAPGRMLGVVGRTGSGKSTLARLLLRFYAPSGGELLVGERDITAVGLDDLRQRVALVTQEVQLFQATVRDNLALFDATIPDSRLVQALADVGLSEWLQSQPAGLDTRLGAGGAGLSAGQAQLLAFARVLLRDPGLIILDEASSRLDPASERQLDQAMARLLDGRTAIVIAHRLSTLDRADDILILESGKVAEAGDRAVLAADPDSRFARLRRLGLEEMLA